MMITANTFLIGAQKAGTTYLAALLEQSAAVCVTDPKEPQYFSKHFESGFDYGGCFSDPSARIRIDASTTYSFLRPRRDMDEPDAPGLLAPVPARIQAAAPDAKFIYILRDPVKRAMSAYRHLARDQQTQPDGPVSILAALEENPMLALPSRYADQIERYLEIFDRERFLFLDFRRLSGETEAVLEEVCGFLDISTDGITTQAAERGKHGAYRSTGAGRVIRGAMAAMPGLARRAKSLVPAQLKAQLLDPVMKAPSEIAFTDEEAAAALFTEDRMRTEALTGIRV